MSNLPQATPVNCLPMHNMTSKLHFCACSNISFSLFFPWLHVLHPPPPWQPVRTPMQRSQSIHAITSSWGILLSLCHHCYATLACLSACLHWSHTHAWHMWGLWRSGFLWGVQISKSFLLGFFPLFFQSCTFAHPLNMHWNTTLMCPHPHLARRWSSHSFISIQITSMFFFFFFFWISLYFLYHTIMCIYSNI